jgi:hypothetical protein
MFTPVLLHFLQVPRLAKWIPSVTWHTSMSPDQSWLQRSQPPSPSHQSRTCTWDNTWFLHDARELWIYDVRSWSHQYMREYISTHTTSMLHAPPFFGWGVVQQVSVKADAPPLAYAWNQQHMRGANAAHLSLQLHPVHLP